MPSTTASIAWQVILNDVQNCSDERRVMLVQLLEEYNQNNALDSEGNATLDEACEANTIGSRRRRSSASKRKKQNRRSVVHTNDVTVYAPCAHSQLLLVLARYCTADAFIDCSLVHHSIQSLLSASFHADTILDSLSIDQKAQVLHSLIRFQAFVRGRIARARYRKMGIHIHAHSFTHSLSHSLSVSLSLSLSVC
jgi:hypothetical protein